ncbi:WhiB family transcriptional regulator [Actinomycetospora soli]|uniref:WhiB family transcriptional regulator n=1 Tax=Actinomycetospora soli TaxID=2893887 RepID=UPI0035563D36
MSTQPAPSSVDYTASVDATTSSHRVTAAGSAADAREVLVPGELYAALAVAAETPAWHRDALCAQADPEAFFPEKGGSPAEAKQVCRRCPVREQCLADAIAHDERFGVWGGVGTRKQRQTLAPTLAPAPAHLESGAQEPAEGGNDWPRATSRRESTPVPRGRTAVEGMAARLPTEPRPQRVMRQGPRSTFPERARHTPPVAASAPATRAATRAASRSMVGATSSAGSRAGSRAGSTVPAQRTGGSAHRALQTAPAESPATATTAASATVTALRPVQAGAESAAVTGPGEDPTDDLAAPAPTPSARPPDGSPRELAATITAILTAHPHLAADGTGADVDPGQVHVLATGEHDAADGEPGGEVELRVAAVALVESGQATRGQTARRFGLRSQDVAHWVACHQQGMPLIETSARSRR